MSEQSSDSEIGQGVRLLRLVNAVRNKHNMEPLTQLETLDMAAWQMVTDMLKYGHRKGHQDTQGSWTDDRAKKAGYHQKPVAKNLAYNVGSTQAAIDEWMEFPEYRENMLNPCYRATGVGYHKRHYVQVFGPKAR